jgi:NAD(P)H-hydrate epimerase
VKDALQFRAENDVVVPAITAEQMREVDRIAVEKFGLGVLQMMENAGRNLAESVMDLLDGASKKVTILAGSGGNGGGGLCCARHLHNRGLEVQVVLGKEATTLKGAAHDQLRILQAAGVQPVASFQASDAIRRARVVVDALIGYSLRGAPQGRVAELIDLCNQHATRVLSLDVPSGLDATSGEAPGAVVYSTRTLTLALHKTGLGDVPGELYLADIGIPPQVFEQIGVSFEHPFDEFYWVRLNVYREGLKEP